MTNLSEKQLEKIRIALVNSIYAYAHTDFMKENTYYALEERREIVNKAHLLYSKDKRFKEIVFGLIRSIQGALIGDN